MRNTSFLVAPIVDHAFFEKAQFQCLLCHDLLQVTGLAAQVFDLVGRRSTRCIPGQTTLASFHEAHAAGGAALTTVAYAAVHRHGRSFASQLIVSEPAVARLLELTTRVSVG